MAAVLGNTGALATNNASGSKAIALNNNGNLVFAMIVGGATMSAPSLVRYNGVNMTAAGSKTSGNGKIYAYYIYNSTPGSQNLTYSVPSNDSNAGFVCSVIGARTSSPIGSTGTDSTSPISTSVSGLESGSLLIDCMQGVKDSPSNPVPGSGQDLIGRSFGNTFYMHGASAKQNTGTSNTMSWAGTFNYWAAHLVIEVRGEPVTQEINKIFTFS